MQITTTTTDGKMILALEGRVDTVTAPELERALQLDGVKDLTLDFAKVPYMSSAGLRCLLVAHKTMLAQGGRMQLISVSPTVKEVLDMTGFSVFLNIVEDVKG